ncbi:PDDEXK nuclease domain-containing protein [Moraxella oblonga]|uniref:PDDEXK nuclease domain-containing protein n=1 Tax=Moraxella oblonga TaxID=200413 RepID=UPI000834DFD5|nr:PDDEXK nuclease domain-containing protein [Moraxella oblonga]
MSDLNLPLLNQISDVIEQSRLMTKQAVNTAMVACYWQIGQIIVEFEQNGNARAEYGKAQLQTLSVQLTKRFGRGFEATNLRRMRLFYITFPNQATLSPKLSWSHYVALIRVENTDARLWYMNEAISQNWSVRALERQISVLYYERLLASQIKGQNNQSVIDEANHKILENQDSIHHYLRDPYILDFLNLNSESYQESDIEQAIISDIQKFLLELGKGFAFVERQKRISFDDEEFYIDLVFYNFKLKCFLLIDLKLGKLKHQDIGQMDTYVRLFDSQYKGNDDNPTIGLVLCSEKSEAVVKYSILAEQKQLFSAKYLPYLPTENELKKLLTQSYLNKD